MSVYEVSHRKWKPVIFDCLYFKVKKKSNLIIYLGELELSHRLRALRWSGCHMLSLAIRIPGRMPVIRSDWGSTDSGVGSGDLDHARNHLSTAASCLHHGGWGGTNAQHGKGVPLGIAFLKKNSLAMTILHMANRGLELLSMGRCRVPSSGCGCVFSDWGFVWEQSQDGIREPSAAQPGQQQATDSRSGKSFLEDRRHMSTENPGRACSEHFFFKYKAKCTLAFFFMLISFASAFHFVCSF